MALVTPGLYLSHVPGTFLSWIYVWKPPPQIHLSIKALEEDYMYS